MLRALRGFLRSRDVQAVAFLLAFFSVQYRQIVWQGRHWLFLDNGWQNYPWHYFVWQHARQGGLTEPTPGMSLGFPLFAEPQAQCFYPLNTAWWPLPDPLVSFTLKMVLHLLALMIGVYVLARVQRFSPLAAAAAAVVVSGSGFMAYHIVHSPIVVSVAWMPWVILLYLRTLRTGSRLAFAGLTLCVAMQLLSSHPQMALYTTLACLLLAPFNLPEPRGRSRLALWLLPVGLVAGAWGLAALIGMVQLAPTYEVYLYGWRTKPDLAFVRTFAATLRELGTDFLGGMTVDYKLEKTAFPGSLALLAILYCLLFVKNRRACSWAVIALVGLAAAWGADNPLYVVVPHIPVINHLRAPSRIGVLLTLGAGLLLAEFLDACPRERRRRLAWAGLGTLGLLEVVALLTSGRPGLGPIGTTDPLGWQLIVLLAALLVAALTRPQSGPRRALRPLVLVLTCAELLYFGWNIYPTYTAREWLSDPDRGIYALAAQRTREDGTAFVRWRDGSPDNIAIAYGVAQPRCFTSMASPAMDALSTWFYGPNSPEMLAAFGVRWIGSPPEWGQKAGLAPVEAVGKWHLFRNPLPVPLAYMPERLTPGEMDMATALLRSRGADPRREVVLPPSLIGDQPLTCPRATAQVTEWTARRTVVQTQAQAPGVVIVPRQWTPHWSATVDGQPAACLTAHLLLLAAPVPPGAHTVTFTYEVDLRPTGTVSLLTLLGCLAWLVVEFRRGRKPRASAEPSAGDDCCS